MTERNFGESVSTWIGIVTNVMDPHQSGRVQIRVFGRHDDVANIPDEDLPWAQVIQPVTSAARGRIGTAPVGVVVGSRVIGIWLDRDQQYPLVLGTVGRAGAPIPGQTDGGSPAVNTAFGSIPSATVNSASNPYSSLAPERITISSVDAGETNIDEVTNTEGAVVTTAVEEGMQFAQLPTTAAADPNSEDILGILNTVDPSSTLAALQCFPGAATRISISIDLGAIAAGFINMVADALTRTLLDLMEQLGVNSVLRALDQAAFALANFRAAFDALQSGGLCGAPAALNAMDAGTRALARSYSNIQTAIQRGANSPQTLRRRLGQTQQEILSRTPGTLFRPVSVVVTAPVGYVQEYHSFARDPYPGYIRWNDPTGAGTPAFTLRNGQPNYVSATQHASYDVSGAIRSSLLGAIRTGRLNTSSLQGILAQATGVAQVSALRGVIGSGSPTQILSAAARLIPSIYGSVTGLFNPSISVSLLPNTDAVQQSMQRFTQAQSVLAIRAAQMENAVRSL
jgi:hypothetical protein